MPAKPAAARKTVVTHPDGTVSTRSSKTRIYAYAVEAKEDRHAWAAQAELDLIKYLLESQSFIRAAEEGARTATYETWAYGGQRVNHYAADPLSGTKHWIGAEVVKSDGTSDRPSDHLEREIDRIALNYDVQTERRAKAMREAKDGPQYTYGVVRWSETRGNASRAASGFVKPHTTYRVLEAREDESAATRAVLRALHGETGHMTQAWESLPTDTFEAFHERATRWLKDATELKTRTIEGADWPYVYAHIRAVRESE